MINETQIARLAAAANAMRPDWPVTSLVTFIGRNLTGRAYRDAAVALAWIATDPKTETPKRVLENGPWWKAANVETPAGHYPPKTEQACPHHPGQWRDRCAGCRADQLAGERRPPAPANQRRPDVTEHVARARAQLAKTRPAPDATGTPEESQ